MGGGGVGWEELTGLTSAGWAGPTGQEVMPADMGGGQNFGWEGKSEDSLFQREEI